MDANSARIRTLLAPDVTTLLRGRWHNTVSLAELAGRGYDYEPEQIKVATVEIRDYDSDRGPFRELVIRYRAPDWFDPETQKTAEAIRAMHSDRGVG